MLQVLLSLACLALVLLGFVAIQRKGGLARPLDRAAAIDLLERVREGRARDADWLVFMGLPVRHDPVLVELRLRCLALQERHWVGEGSWRGPHLFTREGLEEVERLLRWLRREADGRLM